MSLKNPFLFLCNSAAKTAVGSANEARVQSLRYFAVHGEEPNIHIELPRFVQSLYHIPPRILDLLEIASYVYCADRLATRGPRDSVEFHSWSRKMVMLIRVRDDKFWNSAAIKNQLNELLCFVTGDAEWCFDFQPGHHTPQVDLFDAEGFNPESLRNATVALFSGGIDSLSGTVEALETSNNKLCLVTHVSGQPSHKKTQNSLMGALNLRYPGRVHQGQFRCSLRQKRPPDESQRSRAFLFSSIAFAICHVSDIDKFSVFENGVTSMNFPRREDLINARASRTTHPKVLASLSKLFCNVGGKPFQIISPHIWDTKTDMFTKLNRHGASHLISTSTSCSCTFKTTSMTTHCGGCYQCVDRRFSSFASNSEEYDHKGLYSNDFIENISDLESRTIILDYVRQAVEFSKLSVDSFFNEYMVELTEIIDFLPNNPSPEEAAEKIWQLCQRHGQQVLMAINRMRWKFDNPEIELPSGSFLRLVNEREYLKEPIILLTNRISEVLKRAIPLAYQSVLPKNEQDLNDKIEALLNSNSSDYRREYPSIPFALARSVPDHSTNAGLLIEAKYIRTNTTPSRVTEGISADLVKYQNATHILFIVYDPARSITDDQRFSQDFEKGYKCKVCIMR